MQLCIQRHASGAVERGRSSIAATMEIETAVFVMRDGWEGLEDAARARYLGSAQLALARMLLLCTPEIPAEEQKNGDAVVERAEVCEQGLHQGIGHLNQWLHLFRAPCHMSYHYHQCSSIMKLSFGQG